MSLRIEFMLYTLATVMLFLGMCWLLLASHALSWNTGLILAVIGVGKFCFLVRLWLLYPERLVELAHPYSRTDS